MTPQRQAVAQVLEGENVHLSAEVVYSRARRIRPDISMATVYNTLNELAAMGEILEVAAGSGPKRYDPNIHIAHHHLVCTSCGELHDVKIPDRAPTLASNERHGFVMTGMTMVFQGLCPRCQASNMTPAR